jgi:cobyrinic acid a,c-diamide synthase
MLNVPRIVIAGTHSGCGKTTVTLGILAALKKRGLTIQPFKGGPDFIDAGLQRLVAEKPSRNLDQWMCGQDYVIECFKRHAANVDIAVIEGVMGMYDGDLSTASLASLLRAPVILVIDASGMAESAGAVVKGFVEFGARNSERAIRFAGVIFNHVATENHFARLKNSVKDAPVLGYLPREMNFEIPHRHLGLTIAEENPLAGENLDCLADAILNYVDLDLILHHADIGVVRTDCSEIMNTQEAAQKGRRFKLAIAHDQAFNFYYEDNLDQLRNAGADIIRFSPLADPMIPAADAVYLGGGYPEIHAEALSRNTSMLRAMRAWADAERPLYAECGGLMYLSQGIGDFDGTFFPMAAVFPFTTRMRKKPQLGYREIVLNENCILGSKGEKLRGHEFHYSELADGTAGSMYAVKDNRGRDMPVQGFRFKNTLASYVHVHFGGNRYTAEHFAGFVRGAGKS